jgi:hypothetical protein
MAGWARHAIAVRSLHRFMGCLLGGIVALACLAMDVTSFRGGSP